MEDGISVIVCSHNGARRLPATLAHLRAQARSGVPWELLFIDNASTDNSTELVRSSWRDLPIPLRLIRESRLGVRFAREKGLAEAKYKFVAFVDDDNWIAEDWVATAFRIMSTEPRLGALGSLREPVFEVAAPNWFSSFHSSYAILTERELQTTPVPPSYLPTAGLCVRKSAWEYLIERGFRFVLTGRKGAALEGGEDTELTLALRLNGWELRVDRGLRLQHFMPANRLSWRYLRRLQRADATSWVLLDAYSAHNLCAQTGLRSWIGQRWYYQLGKVLIGLAVRPGATFAALHSPDEERFDVIEVERLYGRALGLLRSRKQYGLLRRYIREQFRSKPGPNQGPEPSPVSC